MNPGTVGPTGPRRWSSAVAIAGFALGVLAAAILLTAALGYRTGRMPLGTAFTLLRWGAYGGIAATIVSVPGVVLALTGRAARVYLALATIGAVLGVVGFALPARQLSLARELPPIHDITTDTEDPPQFSAVLPVRAKAPNTTDYDPSVAGQQKQAYPDLAPVRLDMPPAQAFERALEAVGAMGWELVDAAAQHGRIEATDTTFWFGFKDDVVVRIRPADGGSRIDVRSVSRVGRGDVGANARRIRAYVTELTGQ